MNCEDFLKVYQRGEKYLVLNPLIPAWVVTNLNGVLILKIYSESQSITSTIEKLGSQAKISAQSVKKFLDKARAERLFEVPHASFFHKPYALRAVYLNMTARCNLKCIYCFATERNEGNSILTFDDYKKILDAVKNHNAHAEIIFTGGEPLLSTLTLPVSNYSKSLGFSNKLMTNATLITEKNIGQIVSNFDSVKISLDGSTADKHNFYRGRGSYERTIKAIGLLEKFGLNFSLAMVVTKNNVDDIKAMADRWGSRLILQPLFKLGSSRENQSLYLTGKEYFDVLKAAGIIPYFNLKNILDAHKESRNILKCALGDAEISISASGDVYPCQLLHHSLFKVGNIKLSSFDEIYNSARMEKFKMHTVDCIEKCKCCDFKLLCGGSCQARHFSETGSIDVAGNFCEYEQNGIIDGLISAASMQTV